MKPANVTPKAKLNTTAPVKTTGTIRHQGREQNKQHLIDFMQKLTNHIISNKIVQVSVFYSLNNDDLYMLFESLTDDNEYLRKSAAKFICYLLHDNQKIQGFLIEKERICSTDGKFLLNSIHEKIPIDEVKAEILLIIEQLTDPEEKEEYRVPLCWAINIISKEIKWLYWKDKSDPLYFIDPAQHLFGITVAPKSSMSKRIINKNIGSEKTITKPEYLDRLLKRKSIRYK